MPLTIENFKSAAAKLGVDVASVRAVASVESNGKGLFQDGRPAILFERHIFYRELLQKRTAEERNRIKLENPTVIGDKLNAMIASGNRAVKIAMEQLVMSKPSICNPSAGGYVGGMKEYDRLEKAKVIDSEAAHRSCSWGAFQVMGFHAEMLGFQNVFEMVEKAQTEAGQLEIFILFIEKNPSLLKALRMKNWALFAQLYNGPAYKKNQYDLKMASAYNTYAKNSTLA